MKGYSTNVPTIEELLTTVPDEELLTIADELLTSVVPATSATHEFRRKINRKIDMGECCINPENYRKIYLPILSKLLFKEMAKRWVIQCRTMKGPKAGEEATINE